MVCTEQTRLGVLDLACLLMYLGFAFVGFTLALSRYMYGLLAGAELEAGIGWHIHTPLSPCLTATRPFSLPYQLSPNTPFLFISDGQASDVASAC